MRTLKAFGLTLLVAVLVVGMAVAVSAAKTTEASVVVNASFEIPSWISLAIIGNGDVSFASISGPGTYAGSNETELRVMSTTNWSISDSILWSESTLPEGASQDTLSSVFVRTFDVTSGSWGIHEVNVSYQFALEVDDLVSLPEGEYNLVVQYTATTD